MLALHILERLPPMHSSIIRLLAVSSLLSCGGSLFAQQQFTRTINVDGLDRQYLIYLPVDFDQSENMPVMIWHHGGGDNANVGLMEADFRSLANSERFIEDRFAFSLAFSAYSCCLRATSVDVSNHE